MGSYDRKMDLIYSALDSYHIFHTEFIRCTVEYVRHMHIGIKSRITYFIQKMLRLIIIIRSICLYT